MSEAIQPEQLSYPGEAWTEIVRRPTHGHALDRWIANSFGYLAHIGGELDWPRLGHNVRQDNVPLNPGRQSTHSGPLLRPVPKH